MRNNAVIKAVYTGNGVTRRWSIPFDYFDTAEIHVLLTVIVAGLEQETEVDSDSFTIDTDSNEVVYPKSASDEPVPTGTKITIYRSTDTLQQADYTNQGAMWPETLESSLDKIHQVLQEHSEGLARSFTVNMSSNKTPKEYADELIAGSIAAVEAAAGAANSEAAAANSATAAAGSAAAALASQQAAATSATAAAASEAAALASQQAAATSATAATTKAAEALSSQQAAASSETNAAASATSAANSATAAASSKMAAEAAEGRIADRWGLRKKSTAYPAKSIAYLSALPTGWYLECTTQGTTDSGDITLPSPVVENATVTDGTVVWTIRSISAEATTTEKGLLSPSDKSKIDNIPASGGTGFNHRDVITTSGTWTAPTSGYYKVTCIGGGGAGGNGATASIGGGGGRAGGTTAFGSYLSANGGSGGGGGYAYSAGGGGAAGDIAISYVNISKDTSISCVVGAGGAHATTNSTNTNGLAGGGANGGVGGTTTGYPCGGGGGKSAFGSGGRGGCYDNCTNFGGRNPVTGVGGSNGTPYGGGGGGGCYGKPDTYVTCGGANGQFGVSATSTNAHGGDGGNGAIIIEYFLAN